MNYEPVEIQKLYLNDTYLLESEALVLSTTTDDQNRYRVILDRTIFYPKGGGQPADQGFMRSSQTELVVEEVLLDGDAVVHVARPSRGQLRSGDHVSTHVDPERRLLHARLHSAGELLCAVLWGMGYSYPRGWPVVAAIHYPERSSVEFGGVLPEESRENLRSTLEMKLNEKIDEGGAVEVRVVADCRAAAELCGFVPHYLPEHAPIRLVKVAGDFFRPCGGTHVADLSEIGGVLIRKVKCRKGHTVISYQLVQT
jgi:Ser-tRNA(Ala) deacylase AlaX